MSGSNLIAFESAADKSKVEMRETVIDILKTTLAEAERGEIAEIMVLPRYYDTEQPWGIRMSPTSQSTAWIGQLTVTGVQLSARLIDDFTETP